MSELVGHNDAHAPIHDWALSQGFVRHGAQSDNYEIGWSHSSGYGYITFRLYPVDRFKGDGAYEVILETDHGSHGLGIGTCDTVEQVADVYRVLSAITYETRNRPGREPSGRGQRRGNRF